MMIIMRVLLLFGYVQSAISADTKYVEWDTGIGSMVLKLLNSVATPGVVNELIDSEGWGNITTNVDDTLFHVHLKSYYLTASLDSVSFNGIDTVSAIDSITTSGHYNLTSEITIDGCQWSADFSNTAKLPFGIKKNVPFAMTGSAKGVTMHPDLEVLADASKLDPDDIMHNPKDIMKAFVGAHLNTVDLKIAALDDVHVRYFDHSKIGRMMTDQVVKLANKKLLPEITKGLNAVVAQEINKLIDKHFVKQLGDPSLVILQ